MGIAKVSNIIRMARDYKLSNDERTMFDWLVVKQEDFGLGKPFRHSFSQVEKEIHISKFMQQKIIKHFEDLGFLKKTITYFDNNRFNTFLVDFTILTKPEVLGEIVNAESKTYSEFKKWTSILAEKQGEPQPDKNQVDGLDFSIVPSDLQPIVKVWLAYKKEKKQPLKPIGFQSFVKLLTEMSDGNSLIAKSIIEYSIAQNYTGIVTPPSIRRELPGQVIREELDFSKGFFGLGGKHSRQPNMEVGRIITHYDPHKFDNDSFSEKKDEWQS